MNEAMNRSNDGVLELIAMFERVGVDVVDDAADDYAHTRTDETTTEWSSQ